MKRLPLYIAIAATTATLFSGAASAWEKGDFILRAGAATVDPSEDSGELKLNGAGGSGTTAGVDSNTQLGITFTYMVDQHWGVGLLAATPFEHTLAVKGALSSLGDLAEVKHLPPTLTLQYFPLDPTSKFQPFIGAGINYTTFFEEDLKGANEGNFSDLELDDSWGLAAEAGFDYQLTDNLSVGAQVWYLDIDTEASFEGEGLLPGTKFDIDVDIDPWVYMVGLGYKF